MIDVLKKILRAEMEHELNPDERLPGGNSPENREKRVRFRELPKLGHGEHSIPLPLDFLIVCIGRGVKLSRYFLGSVKKYEACLRFGETPIPGDPTAGDLGTLPSSSLFA